MSNYGPKGASEYDPTKSIERKSNNTGEIVGEGPNRNAKSYSSKPGQLSAKQQAAQLHTKKNIKAKSGPVTKPTLTEEEIKRYTENMKAKKSEEDEILEITPDGKQERVVGKEPLKLNARWNKLKKALDHEKAFMDLEGMMEGGSEQQPPQEGEEQPPQEGEADMQPAEQQDMPPEDGADSEAVSAVPEEEGGQPPEGAPAGDMQLSPEDQELQERVEAGEADPQELIDALKEEGYSDQEIAYIVHGQHAAEVDETKAAKADATRAMSDVDIENAKAQAELERAHQEQLLAHEREHKKRMSDLEFEQAQKKHALVDQDAAHKQRMSDVEYQQAQQANPQALEQEHKKRMLDLEYEKAKKDSDKSDGTEGDAEANKQMKMLEVEKKKLELQLRKEEIKMELEFKKREHELKLKMMEAQLKEQAKQKGEISGIKHEQKLKEAKNPPKKPLKKSEEEDDEGRD